MKAIHGGKAKHDQTAAHHMAGRRRGGMMPPASGYPAERRAPRALLRRRMSLTRKRADLLPHVQHTTGQDHWPDIGKTIAYTANRVGGAARCPEPAVPKSIAGDLALIDSADQRLRDLEVALVTTAQPHEANTLAWLPTVPGIGKIRSLVLVYARPDITRFPRVQDVVASCRVVKGAKASAGKRSGTSGTKLGHASLTWAFAAAAVLVRRNNPAGQKSLARFESTHGQGKALPVWAHTRARAVLSR